MKSHAAVANLPAAERIFVRLEEVDAIMEGLDAPAREPHAPRFADLHDFVSGRKSGGSLKPHPRQAASLRRLLANTGLGYVPRLAAAASEGAVSTREGEGCRISLRPSRAEPSQVYVVVEMTVERKPQPEYLFICTRDGLFSRFPLPEADGMNFQFLAQKDSDLVRGLENSETEVFLH